MSAGAACRGKQSRNIDLVITLKSSLIIRFHLKLAPRDFQTVMKLLDSARLLLYLPATFSFLSHTCLISFCVSAQLLPCLTSLLSVCDTYLTRPPKTWKLAEFTRSDSPWAGPFISIPVRRYCLGKPGPYVKYLWISNSSATMKSLNSAGGLLSACCVPVNLRSPQQQHSGRLSGGGGRLGSWFHPKCSTASGWKLPHFPGEITQDAHTQLWHKS